MKSLYDKKRYFTDLKKNVKSKDEKVDNINDFLRLKKEERNKMKQRRKIYINKNHKRFFNIIENKQTKKAS